MVVSRFVSFRAFFGWSWVASATALACALAACTSESKRQSASLLGAVDRYRRASNEEKPARVADIESVSVTEPEVVAAKAACISAVTSSAAGLTKKRAVEIAVRRLERKELAPESAEAQALPLELDVASKLLDEGHAAMGRCEEQTDVLRKKYEL